MRTRYLPRVVSAVLATAVGAAALAAVTVTPAGAAPYDDKVVLSVGHVDAVDLQVVEGEPTIVVHDGTDPAAGVIDRDPSDVVLHVKDEAGMEIPSGFEWIGSAGSTAWLLPMTQDPNLLWPAWATERLPSGYFDQPPVLRLTDVHGPGEVEVFEWGPVGNAIRHFSSDETLPSGNAVAMGSHVHTNWAFSATGAYTLTFEVDAVRDGAPVTLGPVDFAWHVGDLPTEEPVETTLSVTGAEAPVTAGELVTLTAVQDPPTGEDHYHWFVQPPGESEFVVINGALASTYSFTAIAEDDGAQFIVRLYDHDHAVIAESAPVTLEVGEGTEPSDLSQTITATLDEDAGALVVSVDPDDREVTMSPLKLSDGGEHWEATGDLRPIRVTDTRSGRPGWSVSGQVGSFTSGSDGFGSEHLGWAPSIASQSDGQGATAGAPVEPGSAAGDGLSVSRPLASAPAGSGLGTADLGGGLDLHLPTATGPGTYTATLTLTAV